jgi:flagellar basal-body rod modification protein FlgD
MVNNIKNIPSFSAQPVTHDAGTRSEKAQRTFNQNIDSFLLLLTTQLRHQDPTDPQKAHEFTQQLISFNGVEQQIATNKHLEELLSNERHNVLNNASAYIGKTVEVDQSKAELRNGFANFAYNISEKADKTNIKVIDAKGVTVRSLDGNVLAGAHAFKWDGRNDRGIIQPDGEYTIKVSTFNEHGLSMRNRSGIQGVVKEAKLDAANAPILVVNNLEIPLKKVVAVFDDKPLTQLNSSSGDLPQVAEQKMEPNFKQKELNNTVAFGKAHVKQEPVPSVIQQLAAKESPLLKPVGELERELVAREQSASSSQLQTDEIRHQKTVAEQAVTPPPLLNTALNAYSSAEPLPGQKFINNDQSNLENIIA